MILLDNIINEDEEKEEGEKTPEIKNCIIHIYSVFKKMEGIKDIDIRQDYTDKNKINLSFCLPKKEDITDDLAEPISKLSGHYGYDIKNISDERKYGKDDDEEKGIRVEICFCKKHVMPQIPNIQMMPSPGIQVVGGGF